MIFRNSFRVFLVPLFILLILFSSCNDKNETPSTDTTSGEKSSEAEAVMQDGISTANDGQDGSLDGTSGARTEACGNIAVDKTAKTITLDFGTSGCSGADGRTREGTIVISYIGSDIKTSSSRSITFTNYSVNSNTISGTVTQTNVEHPTSTSLTFTIAASNFSIVLSDGKTYSISGYQRNFSYDYGDTSIKTDDVCTITGSSTFTPSGGTATTVQVTNPITLKGSCASTGFYYPVSGTYQITEGSVTYTLDWGSGACDKDIIITVGSKTATKTFP